MHKWTCLALLLFVGVAIGQRYAERNPLPADTIPLNEEYEYDFTEDYGFAEQPDINRWNVADYPHPRENPTFCGRLKPSNVCDPDSVLQKEQADRLDSFIRELYRETPCICEDCGGGDGGIAVGIALAKNIFQPYNEHPGKTIRTFAENLRARWKLGKCDNDILVVVATTDRLSYTDVGGATSSYVSLEEAHRIFLENKAHFSAGHFYEGLRAMLADYHKATRDMERPPKEQFNLTLISGAIVGAVALLGVILFIGFMIYRRYRKNKDQDQKSGGTAEKAEGVSSSWTKQDIKVIFSPFRSSEKQGSSKYQPCKTTDETEAPAASPNQDEEEVIDTTLANPNDTQLTTVTSGDESEALEKELNSAVDNIAQTFSPPKREYKGHMTDL